MFTTFLQWLAPSTVAPEVQTKQHAEETAGEDPLEVRDEEVTVPKYLSAAQVAAEEAAGAAPSCSCAIVQSFS